uniref:Uncharacterized protein n=1 Tax=Lepeophtheirus salmonis TaxID=72036 RepID=A0A0K2UDJ1_LEPSM
MFCTIYELSWLSNHAYINSV